MKKKRKIWHWLIPAVLIVIVIIVFFVSRQSQSASSRYAEEAVRSGSIETYYSFSGNVAVRDNQNVASKANATVREIYVDEDDTVLAGTSLLRLSNGDVIKADITGEVTDVHVSVGDSVAIGSALVDIVNFDNLQVLVKVDEYDVSAVTVGKDAIVTIDALGLTYEAKVEHISKQAQGQEVGGNASGSFSSSSVISSDDVTYYQAKLTAPIDERVLPGMKVDVKILNERADNVTLLSMTALQFDAYNKPFVYLRGANGSAVAQSVTVGIQDGASVQILDGLRSGDTVLVPQRASMFPMMDR